MSSSRIVGPPGDDLVVDVVAGCIEVRRPPHRLVAPALGSCVGVALWDPGTRVGGLAHVMLPEPHGRVGEGTELRFAVFAVPEMVRRMVEMGAARRRIVAKIAGGASMFAGGGSSHIGSRNAEEVKRQLALLKIPLDAEDTGESYARTVRFDPEDGTMVVRSYLYGVKRL